MKEQNVNIRLKYSDYTILLHTLKYIVSSLLLTLIVILIDSRIINIDGYIPRVLLTSVPLARTILGSLTGALLSITIFTFSTIMVVLTTYSNQFSPRVVENFLSEKTTLRVLGLFIGGFLYSVISLLFMKEELLPDKVFGATIGVLYAIVCLIFFVIFINNVSESIQANSLITRLKDDAEKVIETARKDHNGIDLITWYDLGDSKVKRDIYSTKSGYFQSIEYVKLLSYFKGKNASILIHHSIGDFVVAGEAIASIYTVDQVYDEGAVYKISNSFIVESSRNIEHDYLFAIQKLVDISLRTIAPGVNDLNTSIEAINMVGITLSKLASVDGKYSRVVDEARNNQIIYPYFNFKSVLYGSFYQIVECGKDRLPIILAVLKALENLSRCASESNLPAVENFAEYVTSKTRKNFTEELDLEKFDEYKDRII